MGSKPANSNANALIPRFKLPLVFWGMACAVCGFVLDLTGCDGVHVSSSGSETSTAATTPGTTTTTTGGSTKTAPVTTVTPITPGPPVTANQASGVATLLLNIGGTVQGTSYDYLNVAGKAVLGGALIINFINSFTPTPGQKFILVNAVGGVSGTFASIATNGVNVTAGTDANTFFITVSN